jgi:hypothetical protein
VAGFCEHAGEPLGSGAMELVSVECMREILNPYIILVINLEVKR